MRRVRHRHIWLHWIMWFS